MGSANLLRDGLEKTYRWIYDQIVSNRASSPKVGAAV